MYAVRPGKQRQKEVWSENEEKTLQVVVSKSLKEVLEENTTKAVTLIWMTSKKRSSW